MVVGGIFLYATGLLSSITSWMGSAANANNANAQATSNANNTQGASVSSGGLNVAPTPAPSAASTVSINTLLALLGKGQATTPATTTVVPPATTKAS
jgi:hypothetical protein